MAALLDRIQTDLTAAIRAQDSSLASSLRMALAAIKNAQVAGKVKRELTEAEELAVVAKEVAKGKDSVEAYTAGGRQDLVAKELEGIRILSAYLPAELAELTGMAGDPFQGGEGVVAEEVARLTADGTPPSMRLMGPTMKAVGARIAGRADGTLVAAKVRAALA